MIFMELRIELPTSRWFDHRGLKLPYRLLAMLHMFKRREIVFCFLLQKKLY